jgi:hypothetical protein
MACQPGDLKDTVQSRLVLSLHKELSNKAAVPNSTPAGPRQEGTIVSESRSVVVTPINIYGEEENLDGHRLPNPTFGQGSVEQEGDTDQTHLNTFGSGGVALASTSNAGERGAERQHQLRAGR